MILGLGNTRGGMGDTKYRDVGEEGTLKFIAKVQDKAKSMACATTPRGIQLL